MIMWRFYNKIKNRPRRVYGCLFYKVSPTPELQFLRLLVQNARRLRRRVFQNTRMYLRLHLRVLLDLESSPTQLPSLLSHPVETMAGPS